MNTYATLERIRDLVTPVKLKCYTETQRIDTLAQIGALCAEPVQGHTISVAPDKPAILADRLVRRLVKSRLLDTLGPERQSGKEWQRQVDAITEALADEIHQDIIDATLRSGG